MQTYHKINFSFFILLVIAVTGCISSSSSVSSWQTTVGDGTITGSIVASGTINIGSNVRADLRAAFDISGAEIWLQEHPHIRTLSEPDGSFVLENVPYGVSRVVARVKTKDNKTYKKRSVPVEVTSEEPEKQLGQLSLDFARNRVRIILRDEQGNPVSNAVMTLWGEKLELDGDGVYISPPLPDSEILEEIMIVSAGGLDAGSIIAPFTSNGKSTMVSTLSRPGSVNKAPNVWLTTVKEPGEKIYPGDVVKMWAVFTDSNVGDLDKMNMEWSRTGGILASGTSPLPEGHKRRIPNLDWNSARVVSVEWTAPTEPRNYKIKVVVTDQGELSGHAIHPINVHRSDGTAPLPPVNQPPVAQIVGNSHVVVGQPLQLNIAASDPDLDLLKYEWSVTPVAGTFSSTNAKSLTWQAPVAPGQYQIMCRITEVRESPQSITASLNVNVEQDPIIVSPAKIAGHVLEMHTRSPIPQAVVAIAGTNFYRIADDNGYFEFNDVEPGTYTLIATRNGYQTRTYSGITVPAL